ncbi:putative methyltransferase family protein [Spironucleus salmonicida]|uniref:Methyltransferase family protein n=1 Tax=Spironucleus salmonicida TaxID=348837 RepID=V6LYR3_9EUKA|nr:putative methyltransferase family protein [Spironucleus salmonicida]|eukprot:EST49408.1 Putative methyltransferase family protein [Spironucleus salmonicida]
MDLAFLLAKNKQKFKRQTIKLQKSQLFIREVPLATAWVGGGTWDAAVIAARMIERMDLKFQNSLELGSGSGLLGLVVGQQIPTIMTDYMLPIIENLQYNIWTNSFEAKERAQEFFDKKVDIDNFVISGQQIISNCSAGYLNWYEPHEELVLADGHVINSYMPPGQFLARKQPQNQKFELIYGSELTYSLVNYIELVNTIEIYLADNGVFWEILSLFRGIGPLKFLEELEIRNYYIQVRHVSTEFYGKIGSLQEKNRQEQYILFTVSKQENAIQFGSEPLLNWREIQFTNVNE